MASSILGFINPRSYFDVPTLDHITLTGAGLVLLVGLVMMTRNRLRFGPFLIVAADLLCVGALWAPAFLQPTPCGIPLTVNCEMAVNDLLLTKVGKFSPLDASLLTMIAISFSFLADLSAYKLNEMIRRSAVRRNMRNRYLSNTTGTGAPRSTELTDRTATSATAAADSTENNTDREGTIPEGFTTL